LRERGGSATVANVQAYYPYIVAVLAVAVVALAALYSLARVDLARERQISSGLVGLLSGDDPFAEAEPFPLVRLRVRLPPEPPPLPQGKPVLPPPPPIRTPIGHNPAPLPSFHLPADCPLTDDVLEWVGAESQADHDSVRERSVGPGR
jgi:hypothetical protein